MKENKPFKDGALLINKHAGISSFDVIRILQSSLTEFKGLHKKDFPKLGHGGTLDPFATGLLTLCVGRAVKLAQYFLGAQKTYEGTLLFGKTTLPGDPTAPFTQETDVLPPSLSALKAMAERLTKQVYLQTPPMHSAKKIGGKKLYELAREGIEVEREPKPCQLYRFEIMSYEMPRSQFLVTCSSGTYVRTLAQDFARFFNSVGMLENLSRSAIGSFRLENAWSTDQITNALKEGKDFDDLPCFVPFDQILDSFDRAEVTEDEVHALYQGQQKSLWNVLKRVQNNSQSAEENHVALYYQNKLVAVLKKDNQQWAIEKIFQRT